MSRDAWLSWVLVLVIAGRVLFEPLWALPLPGPSLPQLHAAASFGALLCLLALHWRKLAKRDVSGLVALWLSWVGLGGMRAHHSADALDATVRYALPPLLMVLVASQLRGPWVVQRRLLRAIGVASAVPLGGMVLGLLQERPPLWPWANDHNGAHALLLLAVVWTALALTERGAMRIAALSATTLCVLGIGVSGVRTAMVSALVFAIVLLAQQRRWHGRWLAGGMALASAVLVLARATRGGLNDLGSGRLGIWRHSLAVVREWPAHAQLIGVGLREHTALSPSGHHDVHNDLLALTLQLGPIGTALYLVLMLRVGLAAWWLRRSPVLEQRRLAQVVLALLGLWTTANLLSNSVLSRVTPGWLAWSVAGLVLACQPALASARPSRTASTTTPP